ncbi:MAG: family 78 glycoside hydrolase catalytic domain [Solirubrobacteraceae bacterium]
MSETTAGPAHLRVEHLDSPLGIGTVEPRFSWWLPAGSERQLAYRIETDNGWDSGRVASSDSVLVGYGGPPLRCAQRVGWRVKTWTDRGESAWSPVGVFELGLLDAADWSAAWIEPVEREPGPPGRRAAMLLRGEVELARAVSRARMYATAHGIYEAFVNGRRVGDAELTPGYTAYGARLQVQAFDITEALAPGVNAIGALVSDGWFRGQTGLIRAHDQWGTRLAFLAELHVRYDDGSGAVFGTGAGWRSRRSHVDADLIAGQSSDLRRLPAGWAAPGHDDSGWDHAAIADHGYARLVASPAPPVRAVEAIAPVDVRRVGRGVVFDLGQNINGWVRLGNLGPEGTELTLTHGEALDADGDVTTAHLDVDVPFLPHPLPAGQVDRVSSSGRPGEVFEPHHTTHGFRYVHVEGHPGDLDAGDLSGVVVHTDMSRTGWFRCDDERINRLHDAAVWSFRGNACDIPTDCPTRERAGWTGDWQIFVATAAFLYDVAGFSTKWLRDLSAEQWSSGVVANLAPSPPAESEGGVVAALNGSAGWGDAAVIVPWEIYRAYGDARLLEEQWPSMVAWMAHVERAAAEGRHADRIARSAVPRPHERYLWDTGFHWGEWLEPGVDLKGPAEFEAFRRRDKADVATAYFARSARLMSVIATALGRAGDAERYHALAADARSAWQAEFLGDDGALSPDTQASHVRALAFDLVPEELRGAVAGRLVTLIEAAGMHLQTGFLATPQLLPVLADSGHLDAAYALLFQDSPPSWLAMIDRGATTVWERWDGIGDDGTPHESLNHYSKGAVVSFLHRYVAGIELLDDGPGYRHFRIAPRPGPGITRARAVHDSPYGRIEAEWSTDGGQLSLRAVIPPGATAELVLPGGAPRTVAAGRHHAASPSGVGAR